MTLSTCGRCLRRIWFCPVAKPRSIRKKQAARKIPLYHYRCIKNDPDILAWEAEQA